MVGARRSPANGGKRQSESTVFLSASPCKRRAGTETMGTGSTSGRTEMGSKTMRSTTSQPSESELGLESRGTTSGPSEMVSESRGTNSGTGTMARPYVPPTWIRVEVSQNSDLQMTALSKEFEDSKQTDSDGTKASVTQQTDHPVSVSVRRKKPPENEIPEKVTSQTPSSHRRQQRKHSEKTVSLQLESGTPENWLHLPPLVVWQVWSSLSTDSDRIRMTLVSTEWYTELPKLLAPRPWVIGSKMVDGIFHSIKRTRLQELRFKSKAPANGFFSGSTGDFLISETNLGCSLWNPIDGMILPLPLKNYFKIVMLSASDLLAFSYAPGKFRLSFGSPAEEHGWKHIVCADTSIQDICQCGEEFYAVNNMFRIYELDQESAKLVMIGPQQRSEEIRKLLPHGKNPDHILLANLNNDLLVIALGRNLQWVQVFKVAWTDDEQTSLVTIDDLGGWAVFLGKNQSIALNESDFPGIEGNSLYIALEPLIDDLPQTVQVYGLQTGNVTQAEYPSDKLGVPFFYHPRCVSICE